MTATITAADLINHLADLTDGHGRAAVLRALAALLRADATDADLTPGADTAADLYRTAAGHLETAAAATATADGD